MDSNSTAQCIRTVAKLRNISAAAEELGVTQPALSARIKKLEGQLGAAVFDRSKTPLTITEVGEAYLECQDKVDALNRELKRKITALENMEAGRLIVGGASFFNITYLPEAVARFTLSYPGIDIEILDDTVPNLTASALDGKVDLFITPFDSNNSGLEYEKLLTERILLCLPPQSPLVDELPAAGKEGFATLGGLDFALLKDATFIALSDTQQIGRKMTELLKRHGLVPKKVVRVDQTMTSLGLTMAGVGASLITESTLKNNNLKELPAMYLADPDICTRSLYIARPKGVVSGAVREFIKILKADNSYL